MKIEVNLDKKFFIFSLLIGLVAVGFVGVYAYNSGGNPAIFGHSVDEMNWSVRVPTNIIAAGFCMNNSGVMDCKTVWPPGGTNYWTATGANIAYDAGNISTTKYVKAGGVCIGTDCITTWPTDGGTVLPTCTSGSILMWMNGAWSCGRDGNCGIAGTCSQVCINNICKTSWPTGVGDISCASAQAVVRITNGVPTCGPSDTNRYWRYKGDSKIFFCGPTSDNRFTQCNNVYHNGYYYVCYNNKLTMVDKIATCGSNTLCNDLAAGTVCSYVYSATNQGTALSQNFCGYTQNHYLSYQTTGFYVCE